MRKRVDATLVGHLLFEEGSLFVSVSKDSALISFGTEADNTTMVVLSEEQLTQLAMLLTASIAVLRNAREGK